MIPAPKKAETEKKVFNLPDDLRIKKRHGHKKAIIAIARMLLTALYHMLKNRENYNSDLYKKSDILPTTREITVEQAILMAQFQGYRIKSAMG